MDQLSADLRQPHLSADKDYRSSGFLTSDSVLQNVTVLNHAGSSSLSIPSHLYEVQVQKWYQGLPG